MSNEIIPEFRAGQRQLSARHLNQIVHAVRRSIKTTPPLQKVDTQDNILLSIKKGSIWWMGEIDPTGKTDYSDCRYWVKRQKIDNTDSDETSQLVTSDVTFPSDFVYTVTNLAEHEDNSHILKVGQEVIVMKTEDNFWYRYVMSEPPTFGFHGSRDPEGSDLWPTKSDVAGSDCSGNPTNSDHYWLKGWNFVDSDSRLRPWVSINPGKTRNMFAVRVTKTGGIAGNSSDQCTFTYRVTNLESDVVFGIGLSPQKRRPTAGEISPCPSDSFGVGFYSDLYFKLWDANEALATSDCT